MAFQMDCNETFEKVRRFLEEEMVEANIEWEQALLADLPELAEHKAYLVGRWRLAWEAMAIIREAGY